MFNYIYYKLLRRPYKLKVSHVRYAPGRPLVIFLHGIGNSGAVWNKAIKSLPKDVSYIAPDLLGFGASEKPDFIDYNIKIHARSVIKTITRLHFKPSKIVIVGHSLGSLTAIEVARNYSFKVDNLILCSPPFYVPSAGGRIPSGDDILKNIYQYAHLNPNNFLELASRAKKYHLVTKEFELNKENVGPYMNTLKSSIIHQTSLQDAINLPPHIQIDIIRGVLDPLVLQKNIKLLKRTRPSTQVTNIVSGHEINTRYDKAVARDLEPILNT